MTDVLLEFAGVSKSYKAGDGRCRTVFNDVSFCIRAGQVLGLTGPSGSGKSTIARIVLGIEKPSNGTVAFMGQDITGLSGRRKRHHFRQVQMVWQDPVVYLNPYQSVLTSIVEPMAAFNCCPKDQLHERGRVLMNLVGLSKNLGHLKPAQLSGGQCQRVAIARALSTSPRLLVCDEILVNLDLPYQVRIIEMLRRLQKEFRLSILFISHDRNAIGILCSRTVAITPDGVWRGNCK